MAALQLAMAVLRRASQRTITVSEASSKVFDYIVVGAGSAGCVLAEKLSRDPSCRVLLIEAGPKDTSPWIHLPVGYFKTIQDDSLNWKFVTKSDATGLDGRSINWPRVKP